MVFHVFFKVFSRGYQGGKLNTGWQSVQRKDAVQMLLDSGAPLEAIASMGRTALACAAAAWDQG